MTISPFSDLPCLLEGTRYLTRRPARVLGIAAAGMVLFALAAFIQLEAGLPDELWTVYWLTLASLIPLELYFIPRLLSSIDAEAGQNPLNLPGEWKQHFEQRWLRAFLGKVLLYVAGGLGLALLILPGVMVFMMFSWVPLRILLRGESLAQAARASLQIMLRAWMRVLMAGFAIALLYFMGSYLLQLVLQQFYQDPTPVMRLTRPLLWVINFFQCLLSVWVSACVLALFHRVEPVLAPVQG